MAYADHLEIVYKGQKNTQGGIKRAFEVGMISEQTKNELLERHALATEILREVA